MQAWQDEEIHPGELGVHLGAEAAEFHDRLQAQLADARLYLGPVGGGLELANHEQAHAEALGAEHGECIEEHVEPLRRPKPGHHAHGPVARGSSPPSEGGRSRDAVGAR